jgi:hypothetical protein
LIVIVRLLLPALIVVLSFLRLPPPIYNRTRLSVYMTPICEPPSVHNMPVARRPELRRLSRIRLSQPSAIGNLMDDHGPYIRIETTMWWCLQRSEVWDDLVSGSRMVGVFFSADGRLCIMRECVVLVVVYASGKYVLWTGPRSGWSRGGVVVFPWFGTARWILCGFGTRWLHAGGRRIFVIG